MEKNIFKDAYFGKSYKTRDGRKAIFLYSTEEKLFSEYLPCYTLFIENETDFYHYDTDGLNFGGGYAELEDGTIEYWDTDIVSEWEEPIIEEELDKLREELNPNNPHGDTYEVGQYFGFQDGFEAGFKKH